MHHIIRQLTHHQKISKSLSHNLQKGINPKMKRNIGKLDPNWDLVEDFQSGEKFGDQGFTTNIKWFSNVKEELHKIKFLSSNFFKILNKNPLAMGKIWIVPKIRGSYWRKGGRKNPPTMQINISSHRSSNN